MTRCALDLLKRVEESPCRESYDRYWQCLSANNNYYWKCRSEERPFNQCILKSLVLFFILSLSPLSNLFCLSVLVEGSEEDNSRHSRQPNTHPLEGRFWKTLSINNYFNHLNCIRYCFKRCSLVSTVFSLLSGAFLVPGLFLCSVVVLVCCDDCFDDFVFGSG